MFLTILIWAGVVCIGLGFGNFLGVVAGLTSGSAMNHLLGTICCFLLGISLFLLVIVDTILPKDEEKEEGK